MDDAVKQILKSWDFENLRCFFHINKIDYQKFINLTDSDIDVIIPGTNERKGEFKDFYNGYKSVTSFPPVQHIDQIDAIPIVIESDLNQVDIDMLIDQNRENPENELEINLQPQNPDDNVKPFEKFMALDDLYSQIKKNKPLYKLLSKTLMGRLILFKYAENGNISQFREELSKIMIEKEMSLTLNTAYPFLMHASKFQDLADDIVDIFENEDRDLFYEQGYTVRETGKNPKRVNTSGILYDLYTDYKDFIRRAGLENEVSKRASKKTSAARAETTEIDLTLILSKSTGVENVEEIEEIWNHSFLHRQSSAFADLIGTKIIMKFEVLQTEIAPRLINADFKAKYNHLKSSNQSSVDFPKTWPITAKQIIALARSQCDPKKLEQSLAINPIDTIPEYNNLNTIFIANAKIEDTHHSNALAFLILPLLIKYTLKTKSDQWKPQRKDITPSFIRHIKHHEELVGLIDKVTEFKNTNKISSVEPYIVFCGPLSALTCCHVVIDSFIYHFEDSIAAVEFLYKAFFVLKIDYPLACPHVWCFFQKLVFNMERERRIVAKNVIAQLGTDLKSVKQ